MLICIESVKKMADDSVLNSKMEAIRKLISDTKERQATMQDIVVKVNSTNDTLIGSYEASLSIIADISAGLHKYMVFFNDMEQLMEGLRVNETQRAIVDHAKQMNKLGSENIKRTSIKCFEQLSLLAPFYEQNDLPTHAIDNFSKTLEDLYTKTKRQ